MSRQIQAVVLFGVLAVFLYLVNSGIIGAERTLANGQVAYLELAPVDPRSLMQGDYMRLDYAIERAANADGLRDSHRGALVIVLDENNVIQYQRPYVDGEALADGERLLHYHTRGGSSVRVGVDSFFFQEGLAPVYDNAAYAEVRLTAGGTVMLVDLVGDERQKLTD